MDFFQVTVALTFHGRVPPNNTHMHAHTPTPPPTLHLAVLSWRFSRLVQDHFLMNQSCLPSNCSVCVRVLCSA